MKTLAFCSQKGGSGKTTLSLALAVEAQRQADPDAPADRSAACVVDLDRQGSAAAWAVDRGDRAPAVLRPELRRGQLAVAVDAARDAGVQYCIIDTMPTADWTIAEAARLADLVVIPTAPAALDLRAVLATAELVATVGTPAVAMLNRTRHRSSVDEDAAAFLAGAGLDVCPVRVHQWAAMTDALLDGRTAQELKPRSKAAAELRAAWAWLQNRLG